ncbi:extensin [Streptomyces sp. NA04227]|uniref:extensin n=1 Tax=Streptomyces sp. NA04227 TaxID=2742136 RepID=UPI0020CA29FC|nr:extensin [Streptomyces sp. NA04227]
MAPPPPAPHRPLPQVTTPIAPPADGVLGAAGPTVQRAPGGAVGALAAFTSATVSASLGHLFQPSSSHRPTPPGDSAPPAGPPPTYSATPPHSATPPGDSAPSSTPTPAADPPPAYTAVPAGGFDPRELTDFQLDELVHRIIGRVTRLVRTELRMDRERIGRLRDPRN